MVKHINKSQYELKLMDPKKLRSQLRRGYHYCWLAGITGEKFVMLPKTVFREWYEANNLDSPMLKIKVGYHHTNPGSTTGVHYWLIFGPVIDVTDDFLYEQWVKDQEVVQRYLAYIPVPQLLRLIQRVETGSIDKPLTKMVNQS